MKKKFKSRIAASLIISAMLFVSVTVYADEKISDNEAKENVTDEVSRDNEEISTYERDDNFDTTKPTLNAAVSDGLLSIQINDKDSGVKAVYVNGYEFTDLTNDTLNIRLQQFDAGYEFFTISAMDNAGNMSEVYNTKNPYYKDSADESDENPAEQLPVSAKATMPGNATGIVTEHIMTDNDGNTISPTPAEKEETSIQGKEFYTIQSASGKVFYLIIDRDSEEEQVYFLTEITENDLLNVTEDNSQTLPKNSAALESQIPVTERALPNNNTDIDDTHEVKETKDVAQTAEQLADDTGKPSADTDETNVGEAENAVKYSSLAGYLIMGVLGIFVIAIAYYFKVIRKRKEGEFVEDEEEDDDAEYEDDELEREYGSDSFERESKYDDREMDVADTIGGDGDESDSGEE